MDKRRMISMLLCVVMTMCNISFAFAGEYETTIKSFTINGITIPEYDGDSAEVVNGNKVVFSDESFGSSTYVRYGDLDSLKRCTEATGHLDQSLMPTWKRGSISSVYPSGWVQAKYTDLVSGGYLYNRCHLIGWQLTGADLTSLSKEELAKNLITGTRQLNVGSGNTGMVKYENEVAGYIKAEDNNQIAYSVLPVFFNNELVARGVLMQAKSLDSNEVEFCVFCYNVQPGIAIDYETGNSKVAEEDDPPEPEEKISLKDCKISFEEKNAVYNGEEKCVTLSVKYNGQDLYNGTDYMISYRDNVYPGKATVVISGMGKYKDTVKLYFIIVPKKAKVSKTAAKKTSIKITAAKQKNVTGYQFGYRKAKSKKWTYKTAEGKNVVTIKKLKKWKKYNIKVRAYKTVDQKKYYGKWSKIKTVSTKK